MKRNIIKVLVAFVCICMLATQRMMADAVTVTLMVDEQVERPAAVDVAARNLGAILSEINRAQKVQSILTTKNLAMDDFSLKSLLRLWDVTPFYCDDSEVVERCWVFKDGSMMVSHIPLIITPVGEDFGMGTYQEAVVEFDARGKVTDFRLALDAHLSESMTHCGSVVEEEKRMVIMQYVERFRTAYNQRDIDYIEKIFSDDALIITGKVITARKSGDTNAMSQKVEYTKQSKQQYIRNLRMAFIRNKWINVKFTDIAEGAGCAGITRSNVNPNMYGVRLMQEWNSSNYSDKGYLFLLWEFPENGADPIIHVRTWQPETVGNQHQEPDDNISTLGAFDL